MQEVFDSLAGLASLTDCLELDVEELLNFHRLSSGRAFPMNPYLLQSIAVERVEDGTWLFPCEQPNQATRDLISVETRDSLLRGMHEILRAVASCGLWSEPPRLHVHTDGSVKLSPLSVWRRISPSDPIVGECVEKLTTNLLAALSENTLSTHTPAVPPDDALYSRDARAELVERLITAGSSFTECKPSRWINCVDSGDRGAANLGVFLIPAAEAVVKLVDLEFAYGTYGLDLDQTGSWTASSSADPLIDSLTIHAILGEAGLAPRLLGILPHQHAVRWVERHGLSSVTCPRHGVLPRLLGLIMEYIPMAWNVPKRREAPPDWQTLSPEGRRDACQKLGDIESVLDGSGIWAEDIQLFVDCEQRIVLGDLDPYRFATCDERGTGRLNDLSALKTALLNAR